MGKGKGSVEYWVCQIKPGKSCTKLMVLTMSWRVKLFELLLLNSRLKPLS